MKWTECEQEIYQFRHIQERMERVKSLGSLVSITRKDGDAVEGLLCDEVITSDYPYAPRFQGHVVLRTLNDDLVKVCYLDIKDADCTETDEKMEAYVNAGMIANIDTIDDWI